MRRFIPKSFFNPISMIGAAIAGISLFLGIFLMVLDYFAGGGRAYVGIITFIILPMFLILGLAITIGGMIRQWWLRRHARGIEYHFPAINLNDPHHRTVFGFVSGLGLLFLVSLAFGSFQMYEYTESVEFCGLTCHSVMKPEYTAYMYSPHARVSCAECHVGSGADWY
ncbi:MAG: NapC/NirT family cytochrome c, partial [Bacteroidetes bacterium]|nr:NapC/NirT family cytochrome c [Bacteroidota bacterium]